MQEAAEKNDVNKLKIVLDELDSWECSKASNTLYPALLVAIDHSSLQFISILLQNKKIFQAQMVYKVASIPLLRALSLKNYEMAALLLECTSLTDFLKCLLESVKVNDAKALQLLFDYEKIQQDMVFRPRSGDTLLTIACKHDAIEAAEILLKNNCDANEVPIGWKINVPPLFIATKKNNVELVNILLKYGANVNAFHFTSILNCAAESGSFKVVESLLAAGAPLDKQLECSMFFFFFPIFYF